MGNINKINKEIHILRNEINNMVLNYNNLSNEEVLEVSKKLDEIIGEYLMETLQKEKL